MTPLEVEGDGHRKAAMDAQPQASSERSSVHQMEEAGRAHAASAPASRPASTSADAHLATIQERRVAQPAASRGAMPGGQGMDDEAATLLGGHHGKEQLGLSVFGFFKLVTLASALYKTASTWGFAYESDTGYICPSEVICAKTWVEKGLLTGSRFLAGALYASLAISVVSKCYASRAYLHHSWLGTVLDFEPAHELHTYFGFLTLLSGVAHGILHLVRVAYANEAYLMYDTGAFRSGILAMLLLFPIVLPMRFNSIRKRIAFQTRKAMHMLFLVMLIVLLFHSIKFRYVASILLGWYLIDNFYFITKQTFLVSHPTYEAIGRGTMVGIDLPDGYDFKAGSYIYVNCPAIDRAEWHPFSLIPVPGAPLRAAFYAEAVGDWTKDLFRLGLANPSQPLWITAAQPSLVETTLYYDNVLLICTGAGITPAVAVADRFATKKNIHLMWIARDHGMIALFEKQLRMVTSTVHLTGSPADDIKEAMSRLLSRSTNKFCTKKGKWLGDPEAGELLTHGSLHKLTHSSAHKASVHSMFGRTISRQSSQTNMGEGEDEPESTGWGEHGDMPPPVAHDVSLHFGRPDIANFILDALNATPSSAISAGDGLVGTARVNMMSGTGGAQSSAGGGAWGITSTGNMVVDEENKPRNVLEIPEQASRTGRALAHVTEHLDASQKQSRNVLITPSTSTMNNITNNTRGGGEKAGSSRRVGRRPDYKPKSFPWIVIYCGANAKVEEVIASTCDELSVTWRKEYFGGW